MTSNLIVCIYATASGIQGVLDQFPDEGLRAFMNIVNQPLENGLMIELQLPIPKDISCPCRSLNFYRRGCTLQSCRWWPPISVSLPVSAQYRRIFHFIFEPLKPIPKITVLFLVFTCCGYLNRIRCRQLVNYSLVLCPMSPAISRNRRGPRLVTRRRHGHEKCPEDLPCGEEWLRSRGLLGLPLCPCDLEIDLCPPIHVS